MSRLWFSLTVVLVIVLATGAAASAELYNLGTYKEGDSVTVSWPSYSSADTDYYALELDNKPHYTSDYSWSGILFRDTTTSTSYTFRGLSEGTYWYHVLVYDDYDWIIAYLSNVGFFTMLAPGAQVQTASSQGQQFGTVNGGVTDTQDKPIHTVSIKLDDQQVITFDASDGHFSAGMIAAGIHTLYFSAPGYAPQTQVVNIVADQISSLPFCKLSPTSGAVASTAGIAEIFGKVVNGAGQMIPGTCIRIDLSLMPTNPAGEFRFTLVHPGVYTIHYDAPGYYFQTQDIVVEDGKVTRPPTVIMSPKPSV